MKTWSKNESDCPITYTLDAIGGRWKWLIIYKINKHQIMRYGELKRSIPLITHKMLSKYLKDLQFQNLVIRTEYSQIPPKVEYSLTSKGKSLVPILESMSKWGIENKKQY